MNVTRSEPLASAAILSTFHQCRFISVCRFDAGEGIKVRDRIPAAQTSSRRRRGAVGNALDDLRKIRSQVFSPVIAGGHLRRSSITAAGSCPPHRKAPGERPAPIPSFKESIPMTKRNAPKKSAKTASAKKTTKKEPRDASSDGRACETFGSDKSARRRPGCSTVPCSGADHPSDGEPGRPALRTIGTDVGPGKLYGAALGDREQQCAGRPRVLAAACQNSLSAGILCRGS